jgi:hypothetical protein
MTAVTIRSLYKTDWRFAVLERRRARRFQVNWEVAVKGEDLSGLNFDEAGVLENLSSSGAFVYLTSAPKLGAKLDVWIKVPFKKDNWMKYSAEVLRVESISDRTGVAMKFDSSRPNFVAK